ncbi:unnamed protein product [Prorocentrum cordatum]|uniref:VHS domain-containing protein n=1 Tax=Prorocentrum cordatum TaxID=2364126 RepID=A0ABN9TFB6_9DINO|nr:unnamed protein product [Polarella glacialis]
MTDAQRAELEEILTTSLKSNTIEWAVNLRVCDMLQANPTLAPRVMERVAARLQKDSAVPVLLALGLLEMAVKNCGITVCRHVDDGVAAAMLGIVKKREGWRYSLGRNLHKSSWMVGGWLPEGVAIDEGERQLWAQASQKVLEMLKLWTDAFLLQEGELRPVFEAYKQLRQEGYRFPQGERGAATGLCLVQGAEESPAFLAGAAAPSRQASVDEPPRPSAPGGDAGGAVAAGGAQGVGVDLLGVGDGAAAAGSPGPAPGSGVPAQIEATRADLSAYLCADGGGASPALRGRLDRARPWAIRRHVEGLLGHELPDEQLQSLVELLEDLNSALGPDGGEAAPQMASAAGDEGAAAGAEGAVPAPPSAAPPDREQQELYDAILARFLQEQEDRQLASFEEEDRQLALRLSMEEGAGEGGAPPRSAPRGAGHMVACRSCGAPNQLADHAGRGQDTLLFVCYSCGTMQSRRAHGRRPAALEALPARHAPPPRVMTAGGGGKELLIGGGVDDGAGAAEAAGPSSAPAAGAGRAAASELPASFSEGLLGAEGGSSGSRGGAARGVPVGRSVKDPAGLRWRCTALLAWRGVREPLGCCVPPRALFVPRRRCLKPSFEQPAPRPLVVKGTVEGEALQSHLALPRLAPRLMAIGHGGSAVVLGDVPMVTSNAAEEAGGAEGGDGDCLEDDSWADGAVPPGAAAVVLGEAPAAAAAAATAGAVAVEDDDGPGAQAALISAWIRTPGARVADLQPHFFAWPLPRLRAWLAEACFAALHSAMPA